VEGCESGEDADQGGDPERGARRIWRQPSGGCIVAGMTVFAKCCLTLALFSSRAAIPPFADLARNYPNGSDERIKQRIGGRVNAAWIDHTCAVRLSRALNYSGVPVPAGFAGMKVVRGGDGKNYAYQVRGMRPWLEAAFGPPQIRAVRPVDRRRFLGKKGVIAFVIPFANASGHVDLWDGSKYTYEQLDPQDYFTLATEAVLWVTGP
jgi:Type VI secretion system (T6SS), amidase effector protein 4